MSEALVQAPARPPHIVLRDRCRALSVPTWRYSIGGNVIGPPVESGVAGQWLRSPTIDRLVEAEVKKWIDGKDERAVAIFPGCLLVPLAETQRRRRRAITVAMVLSPEALRAEQFAQACQSASLDLEACRTAMSAFARYEGENGLSIASSLLWMHQDLQSLAQGEQNLNSFSRQLTESYEEISLLYKLGQSMNELEAPLRFVRIACDELKAVLSFGWIAAYFLQDHPDARSLANQLVMTGTAPCNEHDFRLHAARLLRETTAPERRIIEDVKAGPLLKGGMQLLVHPVAHHGQVIGAIFAGAKQGDDKLASNPDMKMLDAAAGYLSVLVENARLYDDQQAMFLGTLEALTTSIDAKDPYTCGHSERVAYLASTLALEAGLTKEQAERIRIAGLVHDVGKIGVPETVLCKPGKLTDEEFTLIKKHPEIGHHILKDIPLLGDVQPGVLYHHERYDGRGYPHKLAGESIPLMARIIGLVDAFDAMSSTRTYRSAMNREKVLEEIRKGAGTQFDPKLAESFLRIDLSKYDEMVARHHQLATEGDDRFGRPAQSVPRHAQAGQSAPAATGTAGTITPAAPGATPPVKEAA